MPDSASSRSSSSLSSSWQESNKAASHILFLNAAVGNTNFACNRACKALLSVATETSQIRFSGKCGHLDSKELIVTPWTAYSLTSHIYILVQVIHIHTHTCMHSHVYSINICMYSRFKSTQTCTTCLVSLVLYVCMYVCIYIYVHMRICHACVFVGLYNIL